MKSIENERFLGTVKLGAKGQIVIPKEVREMFGIAPGSTLVLLADKNRGIAMHRDDVLGKLADDVLGQHNNNERKDSE